MAREVSRKKKRKSSSKPGPKPKKVINYDIVAVIIIAIGIFVGISMFTEITGVLGGIIKKLLLGLFGGTAYILCFALIACSIHYIAKKELGKYRLKYILTSILVVFLSVFWHIVEQVTANEGIIEMIKSLWLNGTDGLGGGVIGGLIGIPMKGLLNFWGSVIVLVAVMLILIICIFNISIRGTVSFFKNLFTKEYEPMEEEDVRKVPEKMPPEMQRELKKLKQQIFDFEKEFADLPEKPSKKKEKKAIAEDPVGDMPEKPGFDFDAGNAFAFLTQDKQGEVQATAEPDEEAITQAIDVAAEESLLQKNKKKETPEQVEIEVVNEHIEYKYPSLSILKEPEKPSLQAEEALQRTARKLIETLHSFGVEAKIVDYSRGPTITRYELQPNEGVKISKITNLADDIALNLAAVGIRIEPIPGKTAIGIEVPNEVLSAVYMREVIGTADFANFKSKLAFALGKDIAGNPVVGDIARMPHLLIAGSTGSGKSVCINSLVTSILYKANPNEVKLVMVDPKAVELGVYNGIPHLLIPVVTDPRKAAGALQWAVNEMTNRYKLFADNNVRDLKGYNAWAKENDAEELPQIVIIIDELADLMMVAPNDVEDSICRLAQMARAAGMHLVIATQRPSVDVITGVIKANIPSRIAFAVRQFVDSKTILDMGGAEKLLGKGDMLYFPIGTSKPMRVQGCFVSDKEVEKIVEFVKGQNEANYDEDIIEKIERAGETPKATEDRGGEADELLPQAVEMAIEAGQASVAMYQRRLKVGYQRAARLIDQMEERGIIGPFDGTKPREVLVTKAQWNEMMMNMDLGVSTEPEQTTFDDVE